MYLKTKNEEKRLNGKKTQALINEFHSQKGTKYTFLDYQLQFIKAYQFLRLNEEGHNEDLRR